MKEADYRSLGLVPPRKRIDPPVGPRDLSGLVDTAAACHGGDVALADGAGRLTFAELQQSVAAAAALFAKLGIAPGDRIAASLPNRNEMVIAFFAAMKIGAVWVGMNAILPERDKRHILSHSASKVLLTDAQGAAQVKEMRCDLPDLARIIDVDAAEEPWSMAMANCASATAPQVEVDPFAPAAIMYTSGTTGQPKGVVHSQHNMVTVAAVLSQEGISTPQGVRGSVLPLTITNLMILGPVLAYWNGKAFKCGPTAKIVPLVEWIRKEGVESLAFVPTMIYDLLQADLELPETMRAASGGAPLPQVIRDRFFAKYGYPVATSYGLTEAPTVVALTEDEPGPEGTSGKVLPHLRLSIRDSEGRELPPGTVGEVCIEPVRKGFWQDVYTPALGYWQDIEKSEALLAGGVTHTGDHGSMDEDGWLTIADRSSELILRGGSNVYPAEIERLLIAHPGVAECAVVGKPDLRMGMLTVACIQKADPGAEDAVLIAELRAAAAAGLARYKVPDEWYLLDSFPRNAMGKVIKPRLREMVTE